MSAPDRHPVTSAQEGLVGLELLHPGSAVGTTAEMLVCPTRLDPADVREALDRCHRRHEQLRVRLHVVGGDARQEVLPHRGVELEVHEVDGPGALRSVVEAVLDEPLDPRTGRVTRAVLVQSPDGSRLVHCAHHLVLDGFGAGLLLREFGRHLADVREAQGSATGLPPAPTVAEMVDDDRRRRSSAEHRSARREWAERRSTLPPVADPVDRVAGAGAAPRRAAGTVPDDVRTALGELRAELGVGWQTLLVTVLGGLAARRADCAPVAVGVPAAQRTGPGRVAGAGAPRTAVTVLPVLVPDGAGTLREACGEVAGWERHVVAAHGVTQEHLLALDRAEGVTRVPTAQVNVMPFAQRLVVDGEVAEVHNLRVGPVPGWTLTLRGDWGEGGRVRVEADVNPVAHPELDPAALVDRALQRLATAVRGGAGLRMDALPRCSAAEEELATGLHARNPHPLRARTLHESFARGVSAHPGRVALVGDERTLRTDELWTESLALGRALAARGVRRGDTVGVALPRSVEQVLVVHALLHLGAVYLPLHVGLPAARVETMCADAGVRLVVDPALLDELTSGEPVTTVQDWRPTPAGLDEPAYVLYTSGSTGRPKGVVITHRAIDNRLRWMQDECGLAPGETVLYKTPCSFDVHIWELYWPHQVGACVRVAAEGVEREPEELVALLTGSPTGPAADVVHFVPSMLRALLASPVARRRLAEGPSPREIVCSGEALGRALAEDVHAVTGTWPLNLYGPTEAAVDVTAHRCAPGEPWPDVPLGRPVWNTRCLVLDDALRPVPPGQHGTLWLGGVQLSTGYLGRPDLDRAAFRHSARHGRLYDSGDLASRDADGRLHYHGRRDGQVKIRGQRVELGEIESVLRGAPGVRDAVCLVDGQVLVAHLEAGATRHEPEAVRRHAAGRLAAAMVPARWHVHEALPTTANGKADRAALARVPAAAAAGPGPVVAARTGGEPGEDVLLEAVRGAFAEVLGVDCGPDDGFFALGGDSLGCVRLVGVLERRVGRAPAVREVLTAPSPRELTALLTGDAHADSVDASLVVLSPGAADVRDAVPTVLLPPAGGLCWSYLPLVASLSASGPVWAVQSPLLADRGWDAAELEELCAWQAGVVRVRRGDGPVRLAGWSVGGTCAQAVAAAGMLEVDSLLLLDAYPAEQWAARPAPGPAERLAALARMGGVDDLTLESPPADRAELVRLLAEHGSPLAVLGDDTVDACLAGVELGARLLRAHRTSPWDGPAVHVAATASLAEGLDPAGWERSLPGLRRELVDGDHLAVLTPHEEVARAR